MTKKIVIDKIVEWANLRKSFGAKSVRRVECVVAGESAVLARVVLEQEDMKEIARRTTGTYVPATGGDSKIKY